MRRRWRARSKSVGVFVACSYGGLPAFDREENVVGFEEEGYLGSSIFYWNRMDVARKDA